MSTNLTGKTNFYKGEIIIESDATEKIDEIQVQGTITGQIRVRPWKSTLVLGEKYSPASFTVFSDDQNGKWNYVGFTSNDPDLQVEISLKSTSPTTATYAGTVEIPQETPKGYGDFQQVVVTLKFSNDRLGKNIELKHIVEVVKRRDVTTDPAQVTFQHTVQDQKRIIVVQSSDPIDIDSATCGSPCIKPTLQRIDPKTLLLELVYDPSSANAEPPQNLGCDLQFKGKTLASIPINFITIP
jgi:hypothetical protein